jgi:antitoxin component HigA of HigAB toxin-antitoxin module
MARKFRVAVLRALMDEHGLTAKDVAEITEYHPVVVRQWLCGDKNMGPKAMRICRQRINEHFNLATE